MKLTKTKLVNHPVPSWNGLVLWKMQEGSIVSFALIAESPDPWYAAEVERLMRESIRLHHLRSIPSRHGSEALDRAVVDDPGRRDTGPDPDAGDPSPAQADLVCNESARHSGVTQVTPVDIGPEHMW
jgi:hypothetical protein